MYIQGKIRGHMSKFSVLKKIINYMKPSKRQYVEWRHLRGGNIFESLKKTWYYNEISMKQRKCPKKNPLFASARSLFEQAKSAPSGEIRSKLVKNAEQAAAEARFQIKKNKLLKKGKNPGFFAKTRVKSPFFRKTEKAVKNFVWQAGFGVAANYENIIEAKNRSGTAMASEIAKSALVPVLGIKGIKYSAKAGKLFGTTVGAYKPLPGTVVNIGTTLGASLFVGKTIKSFLTDNWDTNPQSLN